LTALYLADTSAWVKSRQASAPPALRRRFDDLLSSDRIATCDIVRLELLHHEERPAAFAARGADLAALRAAAVGERVCARALEVQARLVELGGARHRSVKLADYLIAAAAELAEFTVLHYDSDYETIARATGQPHEWIARRGTI
jgi:predicted nucleic acid-binding protein